MPTHSIKLIVNGQSEQLTVPSNMTLLHALREKLGFVGTKTAAKQENAAPVRCLLMENR